MATINIKGDIIPDDYADLYDLFGFPYTDLQMVQQALEDAAGEDVDVNINSGGGDVFTANSIYSALQGYTGNLRIHVVGLAASAATIIMCAGQSDITEGCQVMVHPVMTQVVGNHVDMSNAAENLMVADKAIAEIYAAKSGMSVNDALKFINHNNGDGSFLTARDAVDLGLVDNIAESKNGTAVTAEEEAEPLPSSETEEVTE